MSQITVVAVERGYDGKQMREIGEAFTVDESVFKVKKTGDDGKPYAPSWFKRAVRTPVRQTEYRIENERETGDPAASHNELAGQGADLV